jgi:hypothetical protein
MDIHEIDDVLTLRLEEYDRSLSGIKHCLTAYERKCSDLIACIARSESASEADGYFDALTGIQVNLAKLLFARNIEIGDRLSSLTKEFDRLDDAYICSYWLNRFRAGEKWPE